MNRVRACRGDLAALAFLVMAGLAFFWPALSHGFALGPADIGRQSSALTARADAAPLHNTINGDNITQGAVWETINWRLFHQGQLPLWNDLSGTGLPELFNFQSAPLALPSLVSYAVPLSVSYLVAVAAKLLVAGSGTYLATRLLGGRPLAAALAGVTFMLSGSLSGWSAWAVSGPLAWTGWIVAGLILCRRAERPLPGILVLGGSIAFAVYGGFPETTVLLALGLTVLLVATSVVARGRDIGWRVFGRVVVGTAGGLALSAPLWIGGLAVLTSSTRATERSAATLPWRATSLFLAQGYDGLPTRGHIFFGPINYYESAAYVGVVAVALAVLAIVCHWHRPAVAGLVALGGFALLVVYGGAPARSIAAGIGLGGIVLGRMLPVVAFALAVLAGLGSEELRVRWHRPGLRRAMAAGLAFVTAALGVMWIVALVIPLPVSEQAIRRSSLGGPTAGLAVFGVVAALLARRDPGRAIVLSGRGAGVVLLAVQSFYLVVSGAGLNSYSHRAYPVTPAVAELQHAVGSSLVALDAGNVRNLSEWDNVGFFPEINAGYGIHELALHDPTIPRTYVTAWPIRVAMSKLVVGSNIFVPAVTSAALARLYGASYILAGPTVSAPLGTVRVTTIAGMALYRVPAAAQFAFPDGPVAARVLSSRHPGDTVWQLSVEVRRTSRLVLHLTDVPGWIVTADGHGLPVGRSAGDQLSVTVPAGTRTVEAHYAPRALTTGLVLAGGCLLAFDLAALVALARLPVGRHARRT